MGKIEQAKTYAGREMETVFFRPMLSGPDARELGIKIMYNMPVPTTLNFWRRDGDILRKYTARGWDGSDTASRFQKTINLSRVKAEMGYAADDYFNMVYELISARSDVNMDDLSGTELETAETALFREAIAESIRATMWLGDTTRTGEGAVFNTFDGFLKRIVDDSLEDGSEIASVAIVEGQDIDHTFKVMWENASELLKASKNQGELVLLVTSDIYESYEELLDAAGTEAAYQARQTGRSGLFYKGIPVIDVRVSQYLAQCKELPQSFAVLTDRRNLALAVNTADYPGTEVRMWYNPDMMENRQRAVFMAGCDYLLPELVVIATPL